MSPISQETMGAGKKSIRKLSPGEEVVISGMSGIFPGSNSVQEFMENLYNKVDMVTSDDTWNLKHLEIPKHFGRVDGIRKFDAQFFRVHYKQACTMEPMSRKLLEHAYSAIYDSGINPLTLRGKKVGVYIGSTYSESEKIVLYENLQRNGFGITGCNRAMYANRISYWIDAKGPSYALDLACASSTACLEHAYKSIRSGQCDAAIVGGCNLCVHPNVSWNYTRAGFVCPDGKTKCFDMQGDGYARSDTVSVLFLQKAKDAKRIYAQVYHAKSNYSVAPKQLMPIREPVELEKFYEEFYSDIDISPDEVEFIEANGSAVPEADINEIKTIAKVFAKQKPIKIGCVKSNMGSSEPASGICGLTKICLAYHTGKIPGNLHYNVPLNIPEVQNKVKILTDTDSFGRGFAALNSFSYSGANIHVLLKGCYKEKDYQQYKSSIPYLVLVSGRNDSCVIKILNNLKQVCVDAEQIALFHNIHKYNVPGHMSRGYTILESNEAGEAICLSEKIEYYAGNTRPVWFLYSGMGSQWAAMGADLMKIPIFAAAIQKCHKVLEPKGMDIVKILTDPDKTTFDNVLHSFIGIAAVQIGLTDILKAMGVEPDFIIGHSVGELGCAYADGCFSAEEMILAAYSRGLVSVHTPFIRGSMAAVGLGYKTILPMCPPEIEVACHNSTESSTISGPADIMKHFVSELTAQGIFAKEVPCSNIAYHSRYIAEAGPCLLEYLTEVIKTPKERSSKWISTSVPMGKWNESSAKYSSAEYHTNNLLNPVLFEENASLIPSDALVIEIAPHGLLQAILKRSLPDCVHVPLTRRGAQDPVKHLLEAFGKLYQAGLNLQIDALYPKIEFPVSTGTPLLSHNVEWEHTEDWPEAKYINKKRATAILRDFVMSVYDDDYKYFQNHIRDGKCVFPESAFLVLVWETLAMYNKVANYKHLSIVFENIQFHGEVIITSEIPVKLQIMIFKGNNKFEITYEDSLVVSGFVAATSISSDPQLKLESRDIPQEENSSDKIVLNSKDIYTALRLRGYGYKDEFQSIYSSTSDRNTANVKWTGNWITYLDSLLQLIAFSRDHNGLSIPSLIRTLEIDVKNHQNADFVSLDGVKCVNVDHNSLYQQSTRSGGVEIDGLVFKDVPVVDQKPHVLLSQHFVPYSMNTTVSTKTALQVNMQILAENVAETNIKVTNLLSQDNEIIEILNIVISEFFSHEFTVNSVRDQNINKIGASDLVIIDHLFDEEEKLKKLHTVLPENTFVLVLEKTSRIKNSQYKLFSEITSMQIETQILLLLRKVNDNSEKNVIYMPIDHCHSFKWVPQLRAELEKSKKVILVSERRHYSGTLRMVKELKKVYGNKIGLIIVAETLVPSSYPDKNIFKEQIKNNLAVNVLEKGQWGGYHNITSTPVLQHTNIHLRSSSPGNLDALTWVEQPKLLENNNHIQVCYAGISPEDAMFAAGINVSNDQSFGMDFSGINSCGHKVMGVVSRGAIGSYIEADLDLLWPVPQHWTLEDAATVPLAFAQAYYCLKIRTTLQMSSKVLVNGGAGAFGQAVIAICLAMDCLVYVTVIDHKQKEFLKKLFPVLPDANIGYSPLYLRHEIAKDIKNCKMTNTSQFQQHGCDIVVNCLSGSMRQEAMDCVGDFGTFLDMCQYDMLKNEDFRMMFLSRFTNYKGVNFNSIFKAEYSDEKKIIHASIVEGIIKGIVRPLTRVVYAPGDVTRAFRLLSSDKSIGHVLIKINSLDCIKNPQYICTRTYYSPKATYIVICDGTELSMSLCDWLIKNGARKLVIYTQPNYINGYCSMKFLSWNRHNVSVQISSENLQTEKGCVNLLKEATKLGPIRGIFIVHNFNSGAQSSGLESVGAKLNNSVGLVANLDLMSRNICHELDYFAVINYINGTTSDDYVLSATDDICRSREELGLTALAFHAVTVKNLNGCEVSHSKLDHQTLSAMFNALETSLKHRHTNVITYNLKKNPALNFLERISKIIGVKNICELDESLSLQDLTRSKLVINELNTAIKDSYQISYTAEKLAHTSIEKIKNIGRRALKSATCGLGAFFSFIDSDECAVSETVVTMPTLYSSVTEESELDPEATYLMLVPGFEGQHQIFTSVSERLKVQALAFQLAPDMPSESIPHIAADIVKSIKKRIELKSKFYILGYSLGVNIALEMAKIFEDNGLVGVVYCLDSSPDALRAQLDAYLGPLTDSQLQNAIIEHMYQLMSGQNSAELRHEHESRESWDEKVEICVSRVKELVKYSHQYKRYILNSAYRRIMLAKDYKPDFKLNSELILIKGKPHPGMIELPDDYNLSKYTKQPVKVFDTDSDHAVVFHDCRVTNVVNKFLEPKLLEEFNNKDLCWTYYSDPTKSW